MNTYYTTRDFEFLRNRPVVLESEAQTLSKMLFRALVELEYVRSVENCKSGLCASAEGAEIIEEGLKLLGVAEIIEEGMKLLGVADLSENEQLKSSMDGN